MTINLNLVHDILLIVQITKIIFIQISMAIDNNILCPMATISTR